jgi:hypothetical protein
VTSNLNKLVEDIFEGVILVLASFVATFAVLLARPQRGLVWVHRRLLQGERRQIQPRVFFFLAMIGLLLSAKIFVQIFGSFFVASDGSSSNFVRSTYDLLINSSAPGLILAAVVATFVAVAIADLIANLTARLLFRLPAHRVVVANSVLLIADVQVCLIAFMLFVAFYNYAGVEPSLLIFKGWPAILRGLVYLSLGIKNQFDDSPPMLIHWVYGLGFLFVLLLPLAFAGSLTDRGKPRLRLDSLPKLPKLVRTAIPMAAIAVSIDLILLAAFAIATTLYFTLRPNLPGATLSVVSCDLSKTGADYELTTVVVVENEAREPKVLINSDLRLNFLPSSSTVRDIPRISDFNSSTVYMVSNGKSPVLLTTNNPALISAKFMIEASKGEKIIRMDNSQDCLIAYNYAV